MFEYTSVRLVQSSNANSPMLVTVDGILTFARLVHCQNAFLPMLVIFSGNSMLASDFCMAKAASPIFVTDVGITVVLHPAISVLVDVWIMALQLSRESNALFPDSTLIDVRALQPKNESVYIFVTLAGMTNDVRFSQLTKACAPMVLMLLGMVIDVIGLLAKAAFPMEVTVEGIVMPDVPYTSMFSAVSMMPLQSLRESYLLLPSATLTLRKAEQKKNGWYVPKSVTLAGITIDANFEQSLNVLFGRLVSPVKYSSSSKLVISPFPLNTMPRSVTAAASASDSSPSPSVSQCFKQIAFTFASAKVMSWLSCSPSLNSTILLKFFHPSIFL